MKISKRENRKAARQNGQDRKRLLKQSERIARRKGVILHPQAPKTKQALIEMVLRHRPRNIPFATFFRHCLTDYDQVLDDITRQVKGKCSYAASAELKRASLALCKEYLKSLHSDFLRTYPSLQAIYEDFSDEGCARYPVTTNAKRPSESSADSLAGERGHERRVDS